MAKEAFEQKLEALAALRQVGDRAVLLEALRKALRDKSNYYVSKAAAMVGELGFVELTPELLAGFDRFLVDPVKSDPKCWAKEAIVKALKEVGHRGSAVNCAKLPGCPPDTRTPAPPLSPCAAFFPTHPTTSPTQTPIGLLHRGVRR